VVRVERTIPSLEGCDMFSQLVALLNSFVSLPLSNWKVQTLKCWTAKDGVEYAEVLIFAHREGVFVRMRSYEDSIRLVAVEFFTESQLREKGLIDHGRPKGS
jgi:hypothetical protein